MPYLGESQATFERGNSLVEVPFAEVQQSGTETRMDKAGRLIDGLGYPAFFFCAGSRLGENRLFVAVCGVLLGLMILARSIFVFWLPGVWLMIAVTAPGPILGRLQLATCVLLVASLT